MFVTQVADASEWYSYSDQKKIVTILLCLLLLFGQNDVVKLGCEVFLVDINTAFFLSIDSRPLFPVELSSNLQLLRQ